MLNYLCVLTENKPKREIIQTLVRRGYDSDPVKAWKEAQSKDKVFLKPSVFRALCVCVYLMCLIRYHLYPQIAL